MTHSRFVRFGCSALCTLLAAVGAGCGSDNGNVAPDATAPDAVPVPDNRPPEDKSTIPDAPGAEAASADTRDAASGEALDTQAVTTEAGGTEAATGEVGDGGATSGEVAVDGTSFDFGSAASTVQRIANPQVPAADSTALAAANAAFAFDAYKLLAPKTTNLVFSPASISIALAMTYAGAAGTTATQMAQALHFTLPAARLHPAFNALDQALASRGAGYLGADGGPMQVRIVNALWAEQSMAFLPTFLNTLASNYGADVNLLDFIHAPETSRLIINDWVAQQTANKIQDLLLPGDIDNAVKLVLTDAVYFNAAWATPFDPGDTSDGSFTLLDGSSATTKFMNADEISLPAAQGTNYRAVSLPYTDGRLSLVVVVPDVGQFSQVESSLDATALATLADGLTTKRVSLTLPRFRIETRTSLKTLLSALGMTAAFDPSAADFSGMTGSPQLFVKDVIHKAFIDVAEKGTEAAAATAVIMKDASIPFVDLSVRADRPFLYFLRDQPTGAILFMGRVLDPSKS